jgi:hypothetical protein
MDLFEINHRNACAFPLLVGHDRVLLLVRWKRLQVICHIIHFLFANQKRGLLHRRAGPPFRVSEHLQLVHQVILVLPGKARETSEALRIRSIMASHAGKGFLGRNAMLKNLFTGLQTGCVACGNRLRRVLREIIGEPLDLLVAELAGPRPTPSQCTPALPQ